MSVCALRGLECLSFVLVECLIVFDVFQSDNDGFGGQSLSMHYRRDRRLPTSVLGPVLVSAYLGWPRSVETRSSAWAAIGSFAGGAPRTDAWIKGRAGWALAGTLPLRLQTQARCLR
jgi:hypothetical protein